MVIYTFCTRTQRLSSLGGSHHLRSGAHTVRDTRYLSGRSGLEEREQGQQGQHSATGADGAWDLHFGSGAWQAASERGRRWGMN